MSDSVEIIATPFETVCPDGNTQYVISVREVFKLLRKIRGHNVFQQDQNLSAAIQMFKQDGRFKGQLT